MGKEAKAAVVSAHLYFESCTNHSHPHIYRKASPLVSRLNLRGGTGCLVLMVSTHGYQLNIVYL